MNTNVPSYVSKKNTSIPSLTSFANVGNTGDMLTTEDRMATIMSAAASEGDISKMRKLVSAGFVATQEDWEVVRSGAIKENNIHIYCMSSRLLGMPPDKKQLAVMVGRAIRECDVDRILYAQNTLSVELGLADLNRIVCNHAFTVFKEKLFDGQKPSDTELWIIFKRRYSLSFKYEHRRSGSNEYLRLLGNESVRRLWMLFDTINDTFGKDMCGLLKEKLKLFDSLLDGNIP